MHDTQNLLRFHLTNAGADVVIAENGKQACDIIEEHEASNQHFDVVLMDMQMPVMDGYEATKALREKGYSKPIIALTAHALLGDREKCISAGCDDYETKPISRDLLINLVRAWNFESKMTEEFEKKSNTSAN